MSLSLTLTKGVTSVNGGPFPPNYPVGASGFTAAASNPTGDSAGSLSVTAYYGNTIVAIANDAAVATQLLVALEGSFDQTFLGAVTTPDGKIYQPSAAVVTQSLVGANTITTWIWPLAAGGSALANGTVVIADSGDPTIVLDAQPVSSTQINLSWTNSGAVPSSFTLFRAIGTAAFTAYVTGISATAKSYVDSSLSANTTYSYYLLAVYADGTYAASVVLSPQTVTEQTTLTASTGATAGLGTESNDGGFTINPPCSGNSGSIAGLNASIGGLYTHNHAGGNDIVLVAIGTVAQGYFTSMVGPTCTNPVNPTYFTNAGVVFDTSTYPGYSVWRWGPVHGYTGVGDPNQGCASGLFTFAYLSVGPSGGTGGSGGSGGGAGNAYGGVTTPTSGISATFNCACESQPLPADGWTIDTLANLRRRVLIRCGYAAQANNPPPGKAAEINEYLRNAQNQLYRQHEEFRNKRLYAWQMEPNIRYYGLSADESGCRKVDPLSIEWVGFEDLNQAWYPLICGIDPVLYTRAQISTGWPTHYEIRSCIEIFPAPRAAYTLWIKGRFGLDPFLQDGDCTTVDSESVYLLTCGLVKAAYGQVDAQSLLTQAGHYVQHIVAGQHNSRRYVPRTRVQTPMTPPRFLPLEC